MIIMRIDSYLTKLNPNSVVETRWGNDKVILKIRNIITPPDPFTKIGVYRVAIEEINVNWFKDLTCT